MWRTILLLKPPQEPRWCVVAVFFEITASPSTISRHISREQHAICRIPTEGDIDLGILHLLSTQDARAIILREIELSARPSPAATIVSGAATCHDNGAGINRCCEEGYPTPARPLVNGVGDKLLNLTLHLVCHSLQVAAVLCNTEGKGKFEPHGGRQVGLFGPPSASPTRSTSGATGDCAARNEEGIG